MAEPTETSPLLAVENNNAEASNSHNDITSFPEIASYTAARDFFPRPIRILTTSILILSAIALVLLLASDILVANAPFQSYYWSTRQDIEAAGAFVLIAFFAAIINLRVKLPILFNFIIDIFLIWNFVAWLPELFDYAYPRKYWCEIDRYDPTKGTKPGCLPWVLAAKILIGIGGGLAALVALGHLVLLLLRCVAAWKSKFWRRPSSISFPTGELTFQFTIKLLKQEAAPVVPANGAPAASSPQ